MRKKLKLRSYQEQATRVLQKTEKDGKIIMLNFIILFFGLIYRHLL